MVNFRLWKLSFGWSNHGCRKIYDNSSSPKTWHLIFLAESLLNVTEHISKNTPTNRFPWSKKIHGLMDQSNRGQVVAVEGVLLLDPASCVYAKAVVYELFSNDSGLKKYSAESMKQVVGRVNVAPFETMSSLFNIHSIPFKIFTDKIAAIIKSFQWIGKKCPEKR